jgi:DNA-binding SARP family transcriptional activator
MGAVDISILGPLELRTAGTAAALTGAKQRAVLATLALRPGRVVSVSDLIDSVWGDSAPDGAEHSLQQHVSALRKLLGDAAPAIVTRSPGYVLDASTVDAEEFERTATRGFEAAAARRWRDAIACFEDALALWRGAALADARDSERLSAAAARLDENRLVALEALYAARLEAGHSRELVAELEHLVAEHPFREGLRGQLMLALYRSGRQADALAAYQAARSVLVEELGIEPSAELRELEQQILAQSPSLNTVRSQSVDALGETFRAGERSPLGRIELPDGQAVLLIDGITLIGRDPAAAVRLVDNRVSRRHAQIDTSSGRPVLRDLASTNGTTLNGVSLGEQVLRDGDVFAIGGVELCFRSGA